jgi:hypothetical protein
VNSTGIKKVALFNKRHFEEKNGECAACLKYSVLIFVQKKYIMQHLEGSGTPVLYIGRTVLKGLQCTVPLSLIVLHLRISQRRKTQGPKLFFVFNFAGFLLCILQ